MSFYDVESLPARDPLAGYLAACFEDGTREWQGEIGEGDLPIEAIVWSPFPRGPSIGSEIMHIASVEKFWIHEACGGRENTEADRRRLLADQTNVDEVVWPAAPAEPLAWYYEILREIRRESLEVLCDLEDMERVFTRDGWSNSFSVRWIIQHTLQHEAYHGGQAVVLKHIWERCSA